jgi:hypothetical protein
MGDLQINLQDLAFFLLARQKDLGVGKWPAGIAQA